MAEVYRAKDTRLGREVAIKVVSEALGGDGASLERFEREAKVAGSLNHPNIVALHDVGLHDGKSYFVTELLQGETLRQRLAKGPVPLPTALDWAAQMAKGLAAAHERGIVHRDLKPENVFVTRDGHVKLLDFGIAKLLEAAREGVPRALTDETVSPSGSSTGTGLVLGTPGYMSPEQVRGEPVDARSDFFSLGAVLYEMLSGHRAFAAGPAVESTYAIVHHEPEALPASVPPLVAQVVHRCLEKDPALRFQSARDLAFYLDAQKTPTDSVGKALDRSRPRQGLSWWWLAVPSLAIVFLGSAIWATRSSRRGASLPSIQQLAPRPGTVSNARFAPDGRTVFFTGLWSDGNPRVYSTTLGETDYHPFSVDDAQVAAVSSTGEVALILHPKGWPFGLGTLARVPGVGGAPREIATSVRCADWAPDGTTMAVIRHSGERDQVEFPLGHVVFESKDYVLHSCRISPKGDLVATREGRNLFVINREGHKRLLLKDWLAEGVAWAPGGEALWVGGGPIADTTNAYYSFWLVPLDSQPRLLYRTAGNIHLQDVSAQGQVLFEQYSMWYDLAVTRLTGPSETVHLGWLDGPEIGSVSADGRAVLFSEQDYRRPRQYGLYLRSADGSPPVRLGDGRGVALSADGKWALAVRYDEPSRLWVVPTGAGTGRMLEFPGLVFEASPGHFFRDGKHALLLSSDGDAYVAQILDLELGRARAATSKLASPSVAISPDERSIAAVPIGSGVTVFSLEGGATTGFPELGDRFLPIGWSSSGLLLQELSPSQRPELSILRFDTQTRRRTLLKKLVAGESNGLTWLLRARASSDGSALAYGTGVYESALFVLDFGATRR